MEHFVVGISGGTGSGKTKLAKRILEAFPEEAVLVQMDSYYRNLPELTYEERCKINYDHPEAFETELLIQQVQTLKEGRPVEIPQYDFTTHLRTEETKKLDSARIIILEGILVFENPELSSLMDMKIFVDTDADVRILRRAIRDMRERGRSLESIRSQYLETVKPMHEKYVEPCKKMADVIVPNGAMNQVAYEMIVSAIRDKIKG